MWRAHLQKNPLFYRHMAELRGRLGLTVIVKNEAFRLVPQALAAGRVVALIADQNMRKRGVFIDFFGRAAATAKGPSLFALRTGAPVFLGVAVRKPGYPSRYRVIIERVPVGEGAPTADAIRDFDSAARLQARGPDSRNAEPVLLAASPMEDAPGAHGRDISGRALTSDRIDPGIALTPEPP